MFQMVDIDEENFALQKYILQVFSYGSPLLNQEDSIFSVNFICKNIVSQQFNLSQD